MKFHQKIRQNHILFWSLILLFDEIITDASKNIYLKKYRDQSCRDEKTRDEILKCAITRAEAKISVF